MIYQTQEELDAALAYWQKVLRLQDWEITAKLVSGADLDGDFLAHVYTLTTKQSALIEMRRPEDLREVLPDGRKAIATGDYERALVHELLHVHMRLIEPEDQDSMQWTLYERVVETLAAAIVTHNRRQL